MGLRLEPGLAPVAPVGGQGGAEAGRAGDQLRRQQPRGSGHLTRAQAEPNIRIVQGPVVVVPYTMLPAPEAPPADG